MTTAAVQQRSAGRGLVHVFVAAAVATSIFMLCTANELGPFGPLVIAEAFYLLGFAAAAEAAILAASARHFVRDSVAHRRAARSPATEGRRGALG